MAPLTEALSVRVGCFKDQRNANDGIDPNFPPSADFQGLKQKEAVQSGSVSWLSRLAGSCIGITSICLVCVCLLGYLVFFHNPALISSTGVLIGSFCTIQWTFLDDNICGSY